MTKASDEEKAVRVQRWETAVANAKAALKQGDRLRITRCGCLKKTWVTFDRWDGKWIVSRSGISDISPTHIDQVNNKPVDFCQEKAATAA
jgi:hypothetical protein